MDRWTGYPPASEHGRYASDRLHVHTRLLGGLLSRGRGRAGHDHHVLDFLSHRHLRRDDQDSSRRRSSTGPGHVPGWVVHRRVRAHVDPRGRLERVALRVPRVDLDRRRREHRAQPSRRAVDVSFDGRLPREPVPDLGRHPGDRAAQGLQDQQLHDPELRDERAHRHRHAGPGADNHVQQRLHRAGRAEPGDVRRLVDLAAALPQVALERRQRERGPVHEQLVQRELRVELRVPGERVSARGYARRDARSVQRQLQLRDVRDDPPDDHDHRSAGADPVVRVRADMRGQRGSRADDHRRWAGFAVSVSAMELPKVERCDPAGVPVVGDVPKRDPVQVERLQPDRPSAGRPGYARRMYQLVLVG